eukprot:s832_g27.t1
MRDNGIRAADQPAREVDVTVEMQRKARNHELDSKRNGIGCRSLGDKNYRHPEYMSRFFHSGELIVGSGPPAKTYMEKQRERAMQEAEAEVENLTLRWEADTLKDFICRGKSQTEIVQNMMEELGRIFRERLAALLSAPNATAAMAAAKGRTEKPPHADATEKSLVG